jgi:ribokinase
MEVRMSEATSAMMRQPDHDRAIVVVGSINRDTSMHVPHLPRAGETLASLHSQVELGGKGANQAVAARRGGARVVLLGAVGDGSEGSELLGWISGAGVDTGHIGRIAGHMSGAATILVDVSGENVIVLTPGANAAVSADYVAASEGVIAGASVLVVQGELPAATTRASIRVAHRHGVRTIVNLAPVQDLGDARRLADPLVVNEVEAGQLLDRGIDGIDAALDAAAILAKECASVVITLGALGAVVASGSRVTHFPAAVVSKVVDTTGAGDAFVGVLATALANDRELEHAVGLAIAGAAMTVQARGASASYPDFSSLFAQEVASP